MQREEMPRAGEPAAAPVWTVRALSAEIASRLKRLGRLAVEGEVSQIKRATSGHVYFNLKDLDAVVSCAIWRSRVATALRHELREGDRVVCRGELDVYAPRGSYSLLVDAVEARGLGELLARLEQLKAQLREQGWFDRHRPLPVLPRRIGVVTSRDGAAFQDFLRTRSRRWPSYPLRLAHAPVQGAGAAERIAEAIARLDASGVDVIVVCRGGGSLEDLWCFNELVVAQAIRAASVPVVSGVGHETDVTLADHVADHRAHTPTDAAALVLPDRAAFEERIERQAAWLGRALETAIERRDERLRRCAGARVLRDARWILDDRGRETARLGERLTRAVRARHEHARARWERLAAILAGAAPRLRVERAEARLERARTALQVGIRSRLAGPESALAAAERGLRAISPYAVLERGYSITLDAHGRALRDASATRPGERVTTRLARGSFTARVEDVPDAGS